MHQDVELNLAHAPEGKLYIENGRRVLYVFPDLTFDNREAISALQKQLNGRVGARGDWDECIINLKDKSVIHLTGKPDA